MWVLAIFWVTTIEIEIKTTLGSNLKSALFPLTFWAKKSGFMLFCVLKILKSKLEIPGVFTQIGHYFVRNFDLEECGFWYFAP
jgi:hypothetical protein